MLDLKRPPEEIPDLIADCTDPGSHTEERQARQAKTTLSYRFAARPFFAWYDMWIGVYWDHSQRLLYVCPVPMLGLRVRVPLEPMRVLAIHVRARLRGWPTTLLFSCVMLALGYLLQYVPNPLAQQHPKLAVPSSLSLPSASVRVRTEDIPEPEPVIVKSIVGLTITPSSLPSVTPSAPPRSSAYKPMPSAYDDLPSTREHE